MAKTLTDLYEIDHIYNIGLSFSPVSDNLFSRAIHKVIRGKYTHVDIWINNALVTVDPLNKGVQAFIPDDYYKGRQAYIDLTPCVHKYNLDLAAGLNWLKAQKGKGYDWLNIIFCQFLPFNADNKDRWICSELAVAFLQKCRLPITDKPKHVNPRRLYDIVTDWFV